VAPPVPGADVPVRLIRAWAQRESGSGPVETVSHAPMRSLAGAVPEADGLARLAAAEFDAAARLFAEAAMLWTGFHAPHELMCRWAEGEALRLAGDGPGAADRLTAVLADAESRGFEPLAARCRRSLRQSGVRVATTAGGTGTSAFRLTRRERELVDLVEQGLTNLEMARRLGLGRPTVRRILASAMDKVGARRRNELAAWRDRP
jgi:DNA-binding CsgD family transcriptional regulator